MMHGGKTMVVPLAKPCLDEAEFAAALEPLKDGWLVQGPKVQDFEQKFATYIDAPWAVASSSCTAALHLALTVLGIEEGDEVIVPAFTWVATANVVLYRNAKPVFADIDLSTFNVSTARIRENITPRTKAIIPVHLFGLSAEMDPILEIARQHNLLVIEDAACGLGARYNEKHVGTLGDSGCFSFHPRKSITTGEGGMFVTKNQEHAKRVRRLRTHGASDSDRSRHESGAFALPDFDVIGYNYRMTDIQAAIGIAQMEKLEWIIGRRQYLADRYNQLFRTLEWIQTPETPKGYEHAYQSYVILVRNDSPVSRDELGRRLKEKGISSLPGTLAVHNLAYYRNHFGTSPMDCPNAFEAEQRSLALPLYPTLQENEQDYVIDTFEQIFHAL